MTETVEITREQWLKDATAMLDTEFFSGRGYDLPNSVRASVGFPKAATSKAIGQCWDEKASADQTHEIFICPTQAKPLKVLDILLHELIHAAVGLECGHRGAFRKLAKEFGLAGKMTATFAEEGTELFDKLKVFAGRLGDYPHAAMCKPTGLSKPTKWVRYKSTNVDNYRVVINIDRVEEFGVPLDFAGDEMVPVNPLA